MKKLCLVVLLLITSLLHAEDASELPTKSTARSAAQWIKKHPVRSLILAGVVLYVPVSLYTLWLQQQKLDVAGQQLATCQADKQKLEDFIVQKFNAINQKLSLDKLAKKYL